MFAYALARLLCATTFALVLLGGLVHTRGASLACPDWPLCYGMVFPPMQGDILLEHGHRLLAGAVATMSVLLAVLCWQLPAPGARRLRGPAVLGVVLVLLQAALGGITVLWRLPPPISIAHWSMSMLFLAWSVGMVWGIGVARRPATASLHQADAVGADSCRSGRYRRAIWVAAAMVFIQGVVGSSVRHTHASLSCGAEVFSCQGAWLPTTGPAWLQTSHRLLALVATLAVVAATVPAMKWARQTQQHKVRRLALASHVLVTLQVLLGAWTLASGVHLHVVMMHVGFAAALWADLVALGLAMAPTAWASTASTV